LWIGVAVVVVVVVIILGLVFAGVFAPPQVSEDEILKIGTVLPLTGGLAAYGPGGEQGARLAVDEINANGGVLGRPVELFTGDSQTDAAAGRDAAMALIQTNHVDAIVGAYGSGISSAVLQVTKANDVVQVSPASTSVIFSNHTFDEDWFFRTVASDALQGVVAAHYAYDERAFTSMAVIGINNPYGNGLVTVFSDGFESLGGTITQSLIIPEAQASYTGTLADLWDGPEPAPEAVYFVAYPDTGLQLMSDWWASRASWPTEWIFSEGLQAQSFIDDLVTGGIDVSLFEGSAPVAPSGTLYDAFETRYTAEFSEDPVLFASNAYDAVYMIAIAAQKAGTASGSAIQAEMLDISRPPGTAVNPGPSGWAAFLDTGTADVDYEGASGALNWDAFGDPTSAYEIWHMDAANQITRLMFYDEATVVGWLGAPALVSALGFAGALFPDNLMAPGREL
jgi:ABC-type branched-subunit amino acid transport system substrate-binding protein